MLRINAALTTGNTKAAFLDFVIEVVRRIDTEPRLKVLPRRWVVERTFGWLTRWRRLVRDYEQRREVSEAMIQLPWAASCCEGSAIDAILKRTLTITHHH